MEIEEKEYKNIFSGYLKRWAKKPEERISREERNNRFFEQFSCHYPDHQPKNERSSRK